MVVAVESDNKNVVTDSNCGSDSGGDKYVSIASHKVVTIVLV